VFLRYRNLNTEGQAQVTYSIDFVFVPLTPRISTSEKLKSSRSFRPFKKLKGSQQPAMNPVLNHLHSTEKNHSHDIFIKFDFNIISHLCLGLVGDDFP
jgi:hypothetical protein